MRKVVSQNDLKGSDPIDIANRRVDLALLRIFREVSLAIDSMHHGMIADKFWHLIRLETREFKKGLSVSVNRLASIESERRRRRHIDFEPEVSGEVPDWLTALLRPASALPAEVPAPRVMNLLGESLVRDTPAFRRLFDAIERQLEKHVAAEALPSDRNIAWLSGLLALDPSEMRLLSLCAAFNIGTNRGELLALASRPSHRVKALRAALRLDSTQAAASLLAHRGRLIQSGLLPIHEERDDLLDQLQLSSLGSTLVNGEFDDIEAMATHVLKPLAQSAGGIPLRWPHLQAHSDLLEPLLTNALRTGARGVNVLLYGAPGTGKTAYAKQLVERIGAHGYRIDDTGQGGGPAIRSERIGNLRLGEVFAPQNASILVLDEAEDIFQESFHDISLGVSDGRDSKSWMNHVLENNRAPVIWISNKVVHIDPAYLRRFSYCLEFPVMPREVRRQIAHTHLAPVGCSQQLVDAVASHARLAPGLLASAARFVTLTGVPEGSADAAARLMLSGHLRAVGDPFGVTVPASNTRFDLRYLNVQGSAQPGHVLASLERLGRGTVLLCGPAGTGKTQLAAEIARRLGRELVYRTTSDINSKWYGESERNVARLFTECDAGGDVLFVDEAEVLLGDRGTTSHRADRAVTAEFLRRVEAFEGVFVCATNHAAEFDPALMRRFVFRLHLLPLDAAQREEMLEECLKGRGNADEVAALPALSADQRDRLQRLDQLTPGDFANVAARFKALQLELDASAWINQLESEHQAKPNGLLSTMGFL